MIKRGGLPLRGRLTLALLATLALLSCDLFDIFPPEIEIVSPVDNASCLGTLSCEIDATDNRSIAKVELFLDNVSIHEFTKAPYKADLDISAQSAGMKTFKAIAYDQAGNHAEAERQVRIEKESISTPNTPTGPSSGYAGASYSYSYSTGGSTSNAGHTIEYKFDWDDGSYSTWSSSTSVSYSWSSAGTYSVKAQARCATHTGVMSNWSGEKTVSISESSITLTSPNGGEKWPEKSNQTITWETSGNVGSTVGLHYSLNGGVSWTEITAYSANDGSYSWTLPDINQDETACQVKVVSDGGTYSDASDADFTINLRDFFDDFSDGDASGWIEDASSTYLVENGEYSIEAPNDGYYHFAYHTFETQGSFVLEAAVKRISGAGTVGIAVFDSDSRWTFLHLSTSWQWSLQYWDGSWNTISAWSTSSAINSSSGAKNILSLVRDATGIRVSINGSDMGTFSGASVATVSRICLSVSGDSHAHFDDVMAVKQ